MTSSSAWTSALLRPALFFLAVSAAATAISVAVGASRGSSSSATTTTTTTRTTPVVTTTTTTTATTPTTTTTPKPSPKPPPPVPGTWPPDTNGYTNVLESIPLTAGRAFATARARAAHQAGLPRVGVLFSSAYPSLHPGYYVVFSGVYSSSAQASGALPIVHAKGFPDAYQARVAR